MVKIKREILEFEKAMNATRGIWKGESGYKYVRKLRKESEKRLKRLGI